jgi:neutral cholesterol ester hydrolase 1
MSGLNVRVYTPDYEFDSPLPFMVYIHGGGFVIATLEFHDAYLYQTVKNINMTVISIEYDCTSDRICALNPI